MCTLLVVSQNWNFTLKVRKHSVFQKIFFQLSLTPNRDNVRKRFITTLNNQYKYLYIDEKLIMSLMIIIMVIIVPLVFQNLLP